MGFNGEIIVVRSDAEPEKLGRFIGTEGHEIHGDWPLIDGWRAIHVRPYAEPYKYDDEWLAELSANTGAPVLACWVFESDVAHIRGLSGAGAWTAWLNVPYAAYMIVQEALREIDTELFEAGGQEAIDGYLAQHCPEAQAHLESEISLVSRQAAEWAAQAGHSVPAEPVEELLNAAPEVFVQWGFFKLLYRLGLMETDFDPDD